MIRYTVNLSRTLARIDFRVLGKILERLRKVREDDGIVYLLGNGGSAATASHAANDLLKMGNVRAVCLSDMTPTNLAYGNDEGWENMFANPAIRLMRSNDLAIGISCSGNSPNVLALAGYALRDFGFIAFTGQNGGKLAKLADLTLKVPHTDIRIQEDVHLALFHALAGEL